MSIAATFWLALVKVGSGRPSRSVVVVVYVGQFGFNGPSLAGDFAPSPCGSAFDVVLQSMLPFLLVGR
jgi:hypothetical protein